MRRDDDGRAAAAMTFHSEVYSAALRGEECWVRRIGGGRSRLPVRQWLAEADPRADRALIERCDGPTVDLGCGPGRLVAALQSRGVPALGIDVSPMAVAITRFRGAPALQRDLFSHLPGMGRWPYALLADGNVGIAADPVRILAQTRRLLAHDGVAVVEFAPPGTGLVRDRVRMECRSGIGEWFAWAWVGIEEAGRVATHAGLRMMTTAEVAGRHIAWLAVS